MNKRAFNEVMKTIAIACASLDFGISVFNHIRHDINESNHWLLTSIMFILIAIYLDKDKE